MSGGRGGSRSREGRGQSSVARLLRTGTALLAALAGRWYQGAGWQDLRRLTQALWHGLGDWTDPLPPFDEPFYLERHPEAGEAGLHPFVHFLRRGASDRSNPHPLFDTAFYLDRYPDVARHGVNPLVHFLRYGAAERRSPHLLFDTAFYLDRHPDVARSGVNPLAHFLRYGAAERRNPHPLFDTAFYLDRYPDITRSGLNPLVHFLTAGVAEGREPHPLFCTAYYQNRNPDVGRAGLNPLVHYVRFGAAEGRRPHPLFDPALYLERVGGSRGERLHNPLIDFLDRSASEGVSPHALFDVSFYVSRYRDELHDGLNPLVHFVQEGAARGLRSLPEAARSMPAASGTEPPCADTPGPRAEWAETATVDLAAFGPGGDSAADWVQHLVRTARPTKLRATVSGFTGDLAAWASAVNASAAGGSGEYVLLARHPFRPEPGWPVPLLLGFALQERTGAAGRSAETGTEALLLPRGLLARVGGLDPSSPSWDDAIRRLQLRLQEAGLDVRIQRSGAGVERLAPALDGGPPGPGTVLAAVASESSPQNACLAVLRLFAASGRRVAVWSAAWTPETAERTAWAWGPLGLEVTEEPGGRLPRAFRDEGVIDASVVEDGVDPSVIAQLLAVHPSARLFLVSEDLRRWDPRVLAQCDGVVAPGRPATANHLDLQSILTDAEEEAREPAAASLERIHLVGSSRETERLERVLRDSAPDHEVLRRAPQLAEMRQAGAVVGLDVERSDQTEALRDALAHGVPVWATCEVKASVGAPWLEAVDSQAGPHPASAWLKEAFRRAQVDARRLGPGPKEARLCWPWTVAHRPFVRMLRRAGLGPTPAESVRLARAAVGTRHGTRGSFVFLGMIPWHYRYQRPQHLSVELGRLGKRVVYVGPDFLPEGAPEPFLLTESPEESTFCASLRMPGAADIHAHPPTEAQVETLAAALGALTESLALDLPTLVLQAPFWLPACRRLPGARLVYDCMDLYGAFHNVGKELVALEEDLLRTADLVVFTAATLAQRRGGAARSVIVRNGCDFARFSRAQARHVADRVTVGYVGAVDRWFDGELIGLLASSRPDWDFVLVGSSAGLQPGSLPPRSNLHMLGEVDYRDVPGLVAGFDVCLVPFVRSALTECVNPVKVYEYLAAGKPVVATPLPELRLLPPGLVHLADAGPGFLEALDAAVAERSDAEIASMRRDWAAGQTWGARAAELVEALDA